MDLSLLEPITRATLSELQPGEWIWDSKTTTRRAHRRSLFANDVTEPIGFRQIHILDIDGCPISKPFMLSDQDSYHGGYTWVYFEEGRFYRLKGDK